MAFPALFQQNLNTDYTELEWHSGESVNIPSVHLGERGDCDAALIHCSAMLSSGSVPSTHRLILYKDTGENTNVYCARTLTETRSMFKAILVQIPALARDFGFSS